MATAGDNICGGFFLPLPSFVLSSKAAQADKALDNRNYLIYK
jgi:hypothetical protein